MNPEVKKLWIEALRSGNYSQGKFSLRTKDDKYCCLGVLCELAVKSEIIPPATLAHRENPYNYHYDGQNKNPSKKVREWSGLDSRIGELIGMNDHCNKTFPEIADWIEENL